MGMSSVPTGQYTPLYKSSDADKQGDPEVDTVTVAGFYLDTRAVSNQEYLEFARARAKWRKSRIKRIFADRNYLAHWSGDLDLGGAASDAAVVNVSWFAAKAYCKSRGKQLPSVAQWEYAAQASENLPDGRDDPAFRARILDWYARPALESAVGARGFRNMYGIYDMHGLVWEWTRDFNTALVSGESRADAGLDRQLFCGSGSIGSADFKDYSGFMRFGFRSSLQGNYAVSSLGFRCACAIPCQGVSL